MNISDRKIRESDYVRSRIIARGRVLLSFAIVGLFISILLGRLVYLQVIDYSNLSARSSQNRIEIVPIAPVRGRIYDRNGNLLAGNKTVFSLRIIPANVADIDTLLSDISAIVPVSENERQAFGNSLRVNSSFEPQILKYHLDDHQVGRLAVERYRLPGVVISADLHRDYTIDESFSHVVGHLSRIDKNDEQKLNRSRYSGLQYVGKHGVELFGEDLLVGWSGHERVETNAHGQKVRTLSQVLPAAGQNVYLTVDRDLQAVAYAAIGDRKGALVAMDPTTGRILAMVSRPSYDPDGFSVLSDRNMVLELLSSADSPLINRAVQGIYSPGSTIKPFMTLAGLAHSISNLQVDCPGFYQLPGVSRKYRCWKEVGHGRMDYRSATAQSCDVFYYELAKRLGIDRMSAFMSQFGFGEATGVGLQNEKPGILPSKDWKRKTLNESWYTGETLITGIGQSYFSVTMMQLAYATSIIANRGKQYKSQLIYRTVDVNTSQETIYEPELLGKVDISQRHFETVVRDMVEVVHGKKGTARAIGHDAPYTIAGKTGTVQLVQRAQDTEWDESKVASKHWPHGIFTAFAPAESPKIVVAVVVENGKSGSAIAPIARQVMDHYLLKTSQQASKNQIASISTVR
ncbi:MAG: penicillin-binding protein 2 [Acidiferrobacterales bacterium]|nr:penicillin-binding protein 2 [Acidiferrobacterales bacterium]